MHHALEIHEVLSNIFCHCYWPDEGSDYETYPSELASLARTCRSFKELALDLLWEELYDMTPLVRCLPEASYRLPTCKLSFSRQLTQTEWDTLRSYANRVRFIRDFNWGLEEEVFTTLSNAPTSLFSNLRYLCGRLSAEVTPLLYLPFPSLIYLNVTIDSERPHTSQDPLSSFSEFSPNITRLALHVRQSDVAFNGFVSDWICRWQNLHTVVCPRLTFGEDAFVHLSRMPALTQLDFALNSTLTLPTSYPSLSFSNLHHMTLRSESLEPISQLLSQTRVPAVTKFTALVRSCPSGPELSSCLANLQTHTTGQAIRSIVLEQSCHRSGVVPSQTSPLSLDDLGPCMAFSNLRTIKLRIKRDVRLRDQELLALASAWPYLEHLEINEHFGWNMQGASGITPSGLLQLLHTCRGLRRMALVIDAQGYTKSPASGLLENAGHALPHLTLNALDSIIEEESVSALAAFFACASFSSVALYAWVGRLVKPLGWEAYRDRWNDVCRQARAIRTRR